MSVPSDPTAPAGPCVVQASIVQPATFGCDFGVCPATTLAGPVTLTLSPGQSDGLEFAPAFAVGVVARLTPLSGPATTCLNLRGSVEVYDTATRRSRLLAAGFPTDPMVPSDPMVPAGPWRFPLAGLTAADTIRINLFYIVPVDPITPPSNCTVQASVQGPGGVLATKTVVLSPGLSDALVYSDATIGGRRLVRPLITLKGPAASCGNVIPTAELLETTGGRTFVLFPTDPMGRPTP